MANPWDDPDLKPNGDFVKFENEGDSVTGEILKIGKHRFDDGSVAPQILLKTDDGEKTLTVGQVRLKVLFAEQRPNVGDRITVTYTEKEKRAGGKTLKHFDLKVSAGSTPPF